MTSNQPKAQYKKVLKDKNLKYMQNGSIVDETTYLDNLKADILTADISFMDYNQSASDFMGNDLESQIGRMNYMYYRLMLQQCVMPLQQGVNPRSVMQCIGIYAGAALLNKGFRQTCSNMVQQALYPVAKSLPETMQKKMLVNNSMPIGLESAAMMHISWSKQAYNKMREPGVDIEDIMSNYERATSLLTERCEKNGISKEELNQMIRTKIGQLAQRNPEVLTLFKETAYQGVDMADFYEKTSVVYTDNGVELDTQEVWAGEFIDTTGKLSKDKKGNAQPGSLYTGAFTPRPPLDMNNLLDSYQNMLSGMMDCRNVKELNTFFVEHDADNDLYQTMMVSDGHDYDTVTQALSSINKEMMRQWIDAYPDEKENLKNWANEWGKKMNNQDSARREAGVTNRRVPSKFEDILQDSGQYYNYSIDDM